MALISTSPLSTWLPSLQTTAFIFTILLIAGYLLVRAASPKPFPGIPCVAQSAKSILGDVPDVIEYQSKTQEVLSFLRLKCEELNSPVVQVFMRPFRRPWVVVCDAQETQDILTHRSREFDRSDFFRDIFAPTVPENHVHMRTNDEWRAHRRLVADVTSPKFLEAVVAPRSHDGASRLKDLWEVKCTLAAGRPFDASFDIDEMMLDIIFSQVFGDSENITDVQRQLLSEDRRVDTGPHDLDEAFVFPRAQWPKTKKAVYDVTAAGLIPMQSPLGRLHLEFAVKFYPALRAAIATKDELTQTRLDYAWGKFNGVQSASDDDVECATDLVVKREVKAAQKEGRKAVYDSRAIQDEVFGFLEAGHETTGSSLQWALKLLTVNPDAQQKLRSSLRETFARAAEEGRVPTGEELYKIRTPYLDAVVHEILRCGSTTPANARVATTDTEILGYHIPAGTDVFLMTSGPSYTAPAFAVKDSARSTTSQKQGGEMWSGKWEPSSLGQFMPERWLVVGENGETEFDSRAGPMHNFGAGIRGCFGRKIAVLTMRVVLAVVVWNFELKAVPERFGGMDAVQMLVQRPQKTYVRLAKVEGA